MTTDTDLVALDSHKEHRQEMLDVVELLRQRIENDEIRTLVAIGIRRDFVTLTHRAGLINYAEVVSSMEFAKITLLREAKKDFDGG